MAKQSISNSEGIGKRLLVSVISGLLLGLVIVPTIKESSAAVGYLISTTGYVAERGAKGSARYMMWIIQSTWGGEHVNLHSYSDDLGEQITPVAVSNPNWVFSEVAGDGHPVRVNKPNEVQINNVALTAKEPFALLAKANTRQADSFVRTEVTVGDTPERVGELFVLTPIEFWGLIALGLALGLTVYSIYQNSVRPTT